MFLIGQYDSPFVRRVAIALRLYGLPFEHKPWSTFGDAGKLAAFNPAGQCQWRIDAGGQVRGAPTRLGRRLYVAAFHRTPSKGLLMAYHHDGKPAWKEPFTVQAARGDPATCGFVASPLVYGDTVVVGCQDHRLYALDAATGAPRWSCSRSRSC